MSSVKNNGTKMRQIAEIIIEAATAGEYLCVGDIHAKLPWKCAYGSLRKTVKLFEDRGFVEKERAGQRVLIKPRLLLYSWFT